MNWRRGSPLSRAAAIALLVALATGLYLVVASPLYAAYQESIARIGARQQTLGRYRQAQRQEASLQAAADRVRGSKERRAVLLPPSSDSAAAAEVQKRTEAILATAKARLVSVQTLPVTDVEMLRRVGIRIRFSSGINALRSILYALEFGALSFQLDNLTISARTSRGADSGGNLSVGIDILAYKSRRI